MEFNSLIDLLLSLFFLYLLLSILTSSISEGFERILKTRSKMLKKAIEKMLDDGKVNKNYAEQLYASPRIALLKEDANKLPPYISSAIFADSLIEMLGRENELNQGRFIQEQDGSIRFEKGESIELDYVNGYISGLNTMQFSPTKWLLESFVPKNYVSPNSKPKSEVENQDTEKGNMINIDSQLIVPAYNTLKTNIMEWYDSYMEQVSGWFKKKVQYRIQLISIFTVLILNVDSIHVAKYLYTNPEISQEIAKKATAYINETDSLKNEYKGTKEEIDSIRTYIVNLNLPIGWGEISLNNKSFGEAIDQFLGITSNTPKKTIFLKVLVKLLGWFLTIIAISAGAPFWFDLLKKIVNLRSTQPNPQETPGKT